MDNRIYMAFLIGAGRNSATFATVTDYRHDPNLQPKQEARYPSKCAAETMSDALYTMDRQTLVIRDWADFYTWLGRSHGTWAAFAEDAATRLVPHWFSDSVQFVCTKSEDGPTEFVDINLAQISAERLQKFHDMAGDIESAQGVISLIQIRSNLVLTTQPLFVD